MHQLIVKSAVISSNNLPRVNRVLCYMETHYMDTQVLIPTTNNTTRQMIPMCNLALLLCHSYIVAVEE